MLPLIPLFLLAAILIGLFDGIPLIKAKQWRELGTFGALMGTALYLGISKLLNLSTPVNWLHQLLSPIGEAIYK